MSALRQQTLVWPVLVYGPPGLKPGSIPWGKIESAHYTAADARRRADELERLGHNAQIGTPSTIEEIEE